MEVNISKYYVEAYYADDTPILGNLDGQCVIHAVRYRRTNAYKALFTRINRIKSVSYYLIVNAYTNRPVERIECNHDNCR